MSDSEMSGTDNECIDSLMYLLDEAEGAQDDLEPYEDVSKDSVRSILKEHVGLVFFGLNENGHVNYRDATVLGKHTQLNFPLSILNAERLLMAVYLDYDIPVDQVSTVNVPKFIKEHERMTTTAQELRGKYPIGQHQVWIDPQDLKNRPGHDDGAFNLKKRSWKLSHGFRKVVNDNLGDDEKHIKWPKFVVVVTAFRKNEHHQVVPKESFKSPSFEVRSKEQSNKARAARGLTEPVRRRRTPQTAAAAEKLRVLQAEIIAIRDEIEQEKGAYTEYQTCFNFVRAVSAKSPSERIIHSILN